MPKQAASNQSNEQSTPSKAEKRTPPRQSRSRSPGRTPTSVTKSDSRARTPSRGRGRPPGSPNRTKTPPRSAAKTNLGLKPIPANPLIVNPYPGFPELKRMEPRRRDASLGSRKDPLHAPALRPRMKPEAGSVIANGNANGTSSSASVIDNSADSNNYLRGSISPPIRTPMIKTTIFDNISLTPSQSAKEEKTVAASETPEVEVFEKKDDGQKCVVEKADGQQRVVKGGRRTIFDRMNWKIAVGIILCVIGILACLYICFYQRQAAADYSFKIKRQVEKMWKGEL